jgi:hypothetical protein
MTMENERLVKRIINLKSELNKERLDKDWWVKINEFQKKFERKKFTIKKRDIINFEDLKRKQVQNNGCQICDFKYSREESRNKSLECSR